MKPLHRPHVLALGLLLSLLPGMAQAAQKASPGKPAQAPLPPLTVAHWVNGAPVDVCAQKGNVVLVHFWSVVNGPSRALMPRLAALYQKHNARGLLVVGVTEDTRARVEKFAENHKIAYLLAIDSKGATHDAYGVEFLPTVWLVGRDGKLLWRGYAEKFTDQHVLDALGTPKP
ncbi:TlpA family protein disulfide reductase [bacterium]|nr:TlpA family protein disulfide reductase [bacterium]